MSYFSLGPQSHWHAPKIDSTGHIDIASGLVLVQPCKIWFSHKMPQMYGKQLSTMGVTSENKINTVVIQSHLSSFWLVSKENCWNVAVNSCQCLAKITTMI